MRETVVDWIKHFYTNQQGSTFIFDDRAYKSDVMWWTLGLLATLLIASYLIWLVSRLILIQVLHAIAGKTKATWDDHMIQNKVFRGVALIVPLMFTEYFLTIVFFNYPDTRLMLKKLVEVLIIATAIVIFNRLSNAFRDIVMEIESYRDKPIQSYSQVIKIIFSGILIIILLSILTDKSPIFFLTSLGAVSAILLLVFKDTILGFVGSIQLSSNDMIRIGDWVTMDRYGADGDVEEINLTTVKVRNFDKTITTIPTYSFISDSFKNWRGMQESDGRRIKRSVHVQIDSIKFASNELIQRLRKFKVLSPFIDIRQNEIDEYNKLNGFEANRFEGGRKQTNIGLYRRYIEFYLKNNSNINKDMTLMVRQLAPSPTGVPIEVYCFTNTKDWQEYESIQADIFDHLFAVTQMFELVLFENPTGRDFKKVQMVNSTKVDKT